MSDSADLQALKARAAERRDLTPDVSKAFHAFQRVVFADGALDSKPSRLSLWQSRISRNANGVFDLIREPRLVWVRRVVS